MKPSKKSGYFMKRSYLGNSRQSYRQKGNQHEQQQWKRFCPDPTSNYHNGAMPYGPQISNNGGRWAIQPSVQITPHSFGHQVTFPYLHMNNSMVNTHHNNMPPIVNNDPMNNSSQTNRNRNINSSPYHGAYNNGRSRMNMGPTINSGLQINNDHPTLNGSMIQNVTLSTSQHSYERNGQKESHQLHSNNSNLLSSQSSKKKWNKEDALRALKIEEELCKRNTTAPYLVIRFPDPPLDCDIVKGFSEQIEAVHFQKNSSPRYCFVRLAENASAEKVIQEISKIPFGMGYLSAELRFDPSKPPPTTKPEQVDPYTLYIGNLSLSVSVESIKRHFPGGQRYDLAFKSKIKPIRYAFIRYESIEKSIAAFKRGINIQIDGRSLVLRFRRAKFNYPAENSCSERNLANNESRAQQQPPLQNVCGEENSSNNVFDNYESVVKDEDVGDYIKEENYDSEYSYGDECSSIICEYSHSNNEPTIKTECYDNDDQFNSNCTSPTPFNSKGNEEIVDRNQEFASSTNSISKLTESQQCLQSKNHVEVLDDTTNPAKKHTTSTIVPITEKKYIEQLYDQLNSSKVLKKEVLSDFDELDELLKEVN
ncbi:uncharacterized protein LOC101460376 [Ceratitis capitata]|uniref:uncharacterized protein LOC101460376 n=1 Tax=Ceratitis capitata TaxID=7213 RepID=UPI000329AF8F|nr:uncharacterized protein LOC101460376 [Ceratitis capitata]